MVEYFQSGLIYITLPEINQSKNIKEKTSNTFRLN
jgi:hypothetical protein